MARSRSLAVLFGSVLFSSFLVSSAHAALPADALSAAAPLDLVRLKSGGYVRGQVVEHDPAKGTTVVLADGNSRHYDPGEVESVKLADEAAPAPPAAAGSAPAPAPPVVTGSPSVDGGARASAEDEDADAARADDEKASGFKPHVRAGLSAHLGSMFVGGSGSVAVAGSLGAAGRVGIQYHEKGALYYEPSMIFGVDGGGVVLVSWQQVVAEWTPSHFLLAGGLGLAPVCIVSGGGGCEAGNFGTTLRLGYHSGHEDRSVGSAGVFIGGELRSAILPRGAIVTSSFVVGVDYL